ncbi:MAG: endonuclease III domain-containing protein [Candidatus Hydrothermarchaeaceae archaeon]
MKLKPTELLDVYNKLESHFGQQHWWPADTAFEVVVGAILTQNTSWKNVEKAIENLKDEDVLSPEGIYGVPVERLETLLVPSGFFRVKTARLKSFINFLFEKYGGKLDSLLSLEPAMLRDELLGIKGIGKETADSIILYAADKPAFVVDAYTRRVFERLGMLEKDAAYDEIKQMFEEHLPVDTRIYNGFHALIVKLAKDVCKKRPVCEECPLEGGCDF